MVKKLIGRKLKSTRLRNDMTIQELAESSGVSSNMISRIERGLTTPSVEIIVKLADAFGMSISYFVEEAEKGSTIIHTNQVVLPLVFGAFGSVLGARFWALSADDLKDLRSHRRNH